MKISKNRIILLFLVALLAFLSMFFRAYVSQMGKNFDSESWHEVARIGLNNKVAYNNTSRYNYGPIWFYILTILGGISRETLGLTTQNLHFFVSIFLGVVDVVSAFFLYKLYGKFPAFLFLLNPLGVLLSGFHSQIENLAIMFGLISFYILVSKKIFDTKKLTLHFYLSAFFLGISLSAKHILLFFPIWLFFYPTKTNEMRFKRKILYSLIAYFIFIGFFVIEVFRDYQNAHHVIEGIRISADTP